ncbi:mitochondrial carrier [Hesseltinella vesiculosa]|uniref:Mitochondrial carrier n=1 Tax=Hesseltinella vesiculosa TaxID=101127 RepID=A0A1X2G9R5_9FUNG|nr:mitochondrial carrier [Hesseltinella vesiculosa]
MNITTQQLNRHEVLKNRTSSSEKIFSACCGAVATMLFVNPFDLVKTRLQENVDMRNEGRYAGTVDGLVKIVRNEGPFALWRGLSPGLVMAIPSTTLYYVGYDQLKARFEGTSMDKYSPLWIGGAARAMTALVVSPMELFRTRLQSSEGMGGFNDAWLGVTKMVRQEGVLTLWRGLLPTMLRDVPFSAIYWMMYEEMKNQCLDKENPLTGWQQFQFSFFAGATSGTVAAVVTTPMDVIKTRRQVSSSREREIMHLIRSIAYKEGVSGFFRGVVPRVVKVSIASGIMISSYEVGKHFFAHRQMIALDTVQD